MTRDEARAHWARSGLSVSAVDDASLRALRDKVDAALRATGLIKAYRANPAQKVKAHPVGAHALVTCAAHYFTKREAVTFNSDGFIGFAGWADDQNVQPILAAFCGWVDEMQAAREPV